MKYYDAFTYELTSGKKGTISISNCPEHHNLFMVNGVALCASIATLEGKVGSISLSQSDTFKIFGVKKRAMIKIVAYADGSMFSSCELQQVNNIVASFRVSSLQELKDAILKANAPVSRIDFSEITKSEDSVSSFHSFCLGKD